MQAICCDVTSKASLFKNESETFKRLLPLCKVPTLSGVLYKLQALLLNLECCRMSALVNNFITKHKFLKSAWRLALREMIGLEVSARLLVGDAEKLAVASCT